MFKAILNLAWKEMLQLFRDRVLLAFLVVLPVSQLVLIAEATGSGVRGVRLAVWDQDRSKLSQDLITALGNTQDLQLAYRATSYDEVHQLIDGGMAAVALIIPPDFSREALRPGGTAVVPVLLDGTNVIVASNILSTLENAVADLIRGQTTGQFPTEVSDGIELKLDPAFNPTLSFRVSTLPSQLAFITYQVVLVVAAVGLVRERELGTMEQLVVTPISRLELLLGKALMAMLIGLVNLCLLILTLAWGFRIPLRGDPGLLFSLGVLFIITEIGWGTLISTVTTSQQQAILIVFLLAMLEVTFSGYLVPTENMPSFMQFFAQLSPLQHFTSLVRSVYVKGATLPLLMGHVISLFLLAFGTTGLAWVLFARTTDW
jgi:ABC-2 type transport system permease protein